MALHRDYNYYDAEGSEILMLKKQSFKCKEHGIFTITEEQDKDVLEYLNYNCPACDRLCTKSDYVGIRLKGLPNTKG